MTSNRGDRVFLGRDGDGVVEVVDEKGMRSMHFGTPALQTTMFLAKPERLALAYTRCMLLGLIFTPPPSDVLMLGLGGAAMPRFLLHHYPECRVEAVEMRPLVIDVARRFFALPSTPRLVVREMSAADYMALPEERTYDLILVDLHGPHGMAPQVSQPEFFNECRARLGIGGVLAANLWIGVCEDILKRAARHLERSFPKSVLRLPVAGKRNTVALAGISPSLPHSRTLQRRACSLTAMSGTDFGQLLEELASYNRRFFPTENRPLTRPVAGQGVDEKK